MAERLERPHGAGPVRVEGGAFALGGPDPSLVADCVHCGFCLPTCPTYLLWGEEMDSPRGRLYLMREGIEGAPASTTMQGHFDACLGCMACVTACPSGVQYDRLIQQTRAELEQTAERPWRERLACGLIFALFPYRRRLAPLTLLLGEGRPARLLARLRRSAWSRRLPAPLPAMLEVAPVVRRAAQLHEHTPAVGETRGRVALLRGCVQGAFFPEVNAATLRVLAAEGFEVLAPEAAGCCGALSAHSGRAEEAKRFARRLIAALEDPSVQAIIVNAAGCGSALKEYGELLAHDPVWAARAAALADKVQDIAEFLASVAPVATCHRLELTVGYHDACHLAHAEQIRRQPRELLDVIPGLVRKELPEAEICCGSAGVYNLLQPVAARALGDRKAANVKQSAVQLLISANPGCTMQITAALTRQGEQLVARHTVEVLDASIRGLTASELLEPRERALPPRSPSSTPRRPARGCADNKARA